MTPRDIDAIFRNSSFGTPESLHAAEVGAAARAPLAPHIDVYWDEDMRAWQTRVGTSRHAWDDWGTLWPIVAETPRQHRHLLSEDHDDGCACSDGPPTTYIQDRR